MSFAYHGNALALGARITKPTCDVIPSQASAVLASSGGEGTAIVRNFDYKGIISFDEARSYVAGSSEGVGNEEVFNTLATVSIRNLNIANMVHADLIVARVSSRHDGVRDTEGEITFDGSLMEGVRIAGHKGEVTLDTSLFTRYPTYDTFTNDFMKNGAARREKNGSFGWTDEIENNDSKVRGNEGKYRCGVVSASLFESFTHAIPDKRQFKQGQPLPHVYRDGFGIHVREFGTIYLAEVHIKPGQRRLNMLRFDLGCPICGTADVGSVEGNGLPTLP